jgi:hypothetical protein
MTSFATTQADIARFADGVQHFTPCVAADELEIRMEDHGPGVGPLPPVATRNQSQDRCALGILYSTTALPCTVVAYVLWLSTGRGRWRRLGFSRGIVVDPFSGGTPADVRAVLGEEARFSWLRPVSAVRSMREASRHPGVCWRAYSSPLRSYQIVKDPGNAVRGAPRAGVRLSVAERDDVGRRSWSAQRALQIVRLPRG